MPRQAKGTPGAGAPAPRSISPRHGRMSAACSIAPDWSRRWSHLRQRRATCAQC